MPSDEVRAAINGALLNGLPLWVAAAEEGHARKALLESISEAIDAVEQPDWEYAVSTKWGPHELLSQDDAETYAAMLRESISNRRESGDLKYHAIILRRRPASNPGPWEPVPEEETHAQ